MVLSHVNNTKQNLVRNISSLEMMVSRRLSNTLMTFLRTKVSHLSIALTLVRTTTVANLDSKLLVTTSDLAKRKARNMKLGDAAFNIDEYVAKLVTFMGGRHHIQGQARNRADDDDMDWASLGRVAMGISRRPPTMDFLLGPLSVEKKDTKARTKKVTNLKAAVVIRPQEVLSSNTFTNSLVERRRYPKTRECYISNGSSCRSTTS
jgi:hypothetical protein